MLSSIAVTARGKMGKKIGKRFFSGNTLVDFVFRSGMLRVLPYGTASHI